MIPQNVVEEVQAASDIVDVVSSHIPLKRAGRNFKALCPFHNEKTSSFMVSQEKQIWHCFGCGAGGSVFNFIMQYERVSFPEAVRLLGSRAGIEVPDRFGPREEGGVKKADLYRLNESACAWFRKQLSATAGKSIRAYLHKRGMDDALIEEFSLGYAPDSWDALHKAARAKRYSDEVLLKLGLVMRKEGSARIFDRFRNRLMVPISDVGGRIIAFSGRVMGEGTPKYMNSPESILFNKSRSLYGLNQAKKAIVDEGFAIMVEGYFDLYALYRSGIRNVVASQGTAFTTDHARIIKRYADEVVISFDADSAGETAALRGLDALIQAGLRVRILALPAGHDPDTFIRDRGGDAFGKLVGGAPEYFDFLMDLLCKRHGISDEVGKAKVASGFLEALARVPDAVLREAYLKKLSGRISISQESLLEEIKRKTRRSTSQETAQPEIRLPASEREIVRLMLADGDIARIVAENLDAMDFRNEQLRIIVGMAFEMLGNGEWVDSPRLLTRLLDERCSRIVSRLATEEDPGGDREQVARDCIERIKERSRRDNRRRIIEEIARKEKEGAPVDVILKLQKMLMKEHIKKQIC